MTWNKLAKPLLLLGLWCSWLGMYLGTACISAGSALLIVVGLPTLIKPRTGLMQHPLLKPIILFLFVVVGSAVIAAPPPFFKPVFKLRYFSCLLLSSYIFSWAPVLRNRILRVAQFIPLLLGPIAFLQYFKIFYPLRFFFNLETDGLASGFLTHHTAFGLSMVYIFVLLISQILDAKSWHQRAFIFVGAFMAAGSVLLSLSRGAFLALFAATVVLVFFQNSKKTNARLFFVLLLSLVLAFALNKKIQDHFIHPDFSSFKQRITLAQFAWDQFKLHPLFGFGYGRFDQEIEKHPKIKLAAGNHGHAHNIFLDLLSGSGLVGFSAFCFLVGIITVRLIKNLQERGESRAWNLGLFGIWTAFLVGGFFDEYLTWSQILVPTFILVGSSFQWPQPHSEKYHAQSIQS